MDTEKSETRVIPSITTEDSSSLGDIKINHAVVASIVRLSALENGGVFAVGGSFVDGIAEIFSKKEASERGVRVTENENGHYHIEIRLILNYGVELAKCAYDVQVAVKDRVENMTGKLVERADVVIDGVKSKDDHPGADANNSLGVEE
ncbi:MAG: Asp23/Gls24 family envelope stress response protein [Opitutaceae bacterium]|nr:Asp23/Gls24 family envelope stress response protein [Opitutaceae bacterium]|tara:strand:+ start:1410 stop:1853 length:444 start_codon:yes stop_codon:yes gene_type:complete